MPICYTAAMEVRHQLARLLADGRPRSGAQLAQSLGLPRSHLPRQLSALAALDLEVEAVRGRGYRLARPLELLDAARILAELPAASRARLAGLEVLAEVDSTNRYLLEHPSRGAPGVLACLAEMQTAGRGRRGRGWVSPFATNVYLSVLSRFAVRPAALQGLSLAVGIAAARAVESVGGRGVALKWPNDLWLAGRKLGGVLVETVAAGAAATDAVAGIGINVEVPAPARAQIDQAWTDLHTAGVRVARNHLAARVLDEVLGIAESFRAHGFGALHRDWRRFDVLHGREVEVDGPCGRMHGRAAGVDTDGALLLEVDGRRRRVLSAEVSVRPAGDGAARAGTAT